MDNLIIGGTGKGNGGTPPPAAQDLIKDSDTRRFMADVIETSRKVPVLVDFWAEWCGPCRQMGPTVDAIAVEYAGRAKVGKLNVDENGGTAMRYNIRGIPTLLVFKGGQVVGQKVGAVGKTDVQQLLQPHI